MELIKIRDIETPIDEIINYDEFNNNENRDIIFKTCSYQNVDGKKYLIRNIFLEENLKKYKPEELTDDFLPTTETLIKEIQNKDEELLKKYRDNDIKCYNREMTLRVKCLSLYKMGKSMMTNTLELSIKDRDKLKEIMLSYNDIPHIDIIKEFNENASQNIFDNIDVSGLPIYSLN